MLVRLEHHDAWTFPKGKIEDLVDGGDPRGAALREACEEAGAHGDLEAQPLTIYRYPRGSEGDEVVVEAYLLRVLTQGPPSRGEQFRDPTWFAPEEARARLGQNREPHYALEHGRVIDEALQHLAAAA